MARDTGVAWVGVRRSNHAGPAGLYAEMPTAHGMIGLYAAVANANHMATWGGADLLLGTNPLAIGVPSGSGPLVLDMATSIVAYGTVKKYALRGLTMPEGWFVKPETGEPITDPNRSHEGILLPMGEYKGAGLALMLGLLGGVLNGAAFGRDVVDFNADDSSETNTGHFMVAIDIARFCRLRPSPPKSIAMCAISAPRSACPASTTSACPATAARNAAPSGCATACRLRQRCWRSSISSRRS